MSYVNVYLTLVSGKGLASRDANGKSDPYVRVELLDGDKKLIEVCFTGVSTCLNLTDDCVHRELKKSLA